MTRLVSWMSAMFERGWWVISDEIYRRIVYGAPAASALDVSPTRDNLVVVNGVAKVTCVILLNAIGSNILQHATHIFR